MHCKSYPLLYQAYKVILTFSVTQVACERTFSKLKYVKNCLRSENRLDSLLFMFVERDILARVSNAVMALIGCEQSGRTRPPKVHQKVALLHKKLLYFFIVGYHQDVNGMSKRKEKKFKDQQHAWLLLLIGCCVTCGCGSVEV